MITASRYHQRERQRKEAWLRDVLRGIKLAEEDGRIRTPLGAELIRTRDRLRRELGVFGG